MFYNHLVNWSTSTKHPAGIFIVIVLNLGYLVQHGESILYNIFESC